MEKPKISSQGTLMAPLGIAQRQSTDVTAVDHPLIAQAMQFIRDHACDGINVEEVLRNIPLSRRLLEGKISQAIRFVAWTLSTQAIVNSKTTYGCLNGIHLTAQVTG